jgi:NADP-dependent 3-hydroxy acid dehydrogenase YdfG
MNGALSSASARSFATETAACTGLGVGRGIYAVTGADAGLGLATTAALIEAGGVVVMGCADPEKGRVLAAKINGVTKQESAIVLADGGW